MERAAWRPPSLILPIRVVLLTIVASWAAGCSLSGSDNDSDPQPGAGRPPAAGMGPPSGAVRVEGTGEIAVPHVIANRAYGLPGTSGPRRLATAVNAPFTVNLSPAAVSRPGAGRVFAYHAFRARRPVLRVYDGVRRRDSVLANRAFSVAWRRDETMAFFQGSRRSVEDVTRYRGHIVVRGPARGRSVRWTSTPGAYVVAAWAGDALIAYRRSRLSADLLIFDGPRRARVLAEDSFLVALSPDGRQAFISRPAASGATVEVVDVASGESAGRRPARDRPAAGDQPTTFVAAGSWFGERVVGATNLGLAVYRVGSDRIVLEQTLDVDADTFPVGLNEPQVDESGRTIVSWADLAAKPRQAVAEAALVECDRSTLKCRQAPPAPGLQPPRVIYNPSRP